MSPASHSTPRYLPTSFIPLFICGVSFHSCISAIPSQAYEKTPETLEVTSLVPCLSEKNCNETFKPSSGRINSGSIPSQSSPKADKENLSQFEWDDKAVVERYGSPVEKGTLEGSSGARAGGPRVGDRRYMGRGCPYERCRFQLEGQSVRVLHVLLVQGLVQTIHLQECLSARDGKFRDTSSILSQVKLFITSHCVIMLLRTHSWRIEGRPLDRSFRIDSVVHALNERGLLSEIHTMKVEGI